MVMNTTKPKGFFSRLLASLLSILPWTAKPAPPPQPPPPPAPQFPPAPRLGKKILVVDDDAVILKILSRKLGAHGYDVETAADPAEALAVARSIKPDLILLDLVFPPDVNFGGGVGWDGFRVMNWLHTSGVACNIPIFIISGETPDHCKDRCLANGAVAFFQKPVDYDQLLSAIKHALWKDAGPPKPVLTSGVPA